MAYLSVAAVVATAATVYLLFFKTAKVNLKIQGQLNDKYDFIVVGSGAAGAVVASRLSENPDVHVLLLEAGTADDSPNIHTPLIWSHNLATDLDWQFKTVPQQFCCDGSENRQMVLPQGKVIGGSTSINGMGYVRGSRYDFDNWEADGCTDWGYDDVLPYFIKAEGNQNPEYAANGYHGSDGPLKVTDSTTELDGILGNALWELGIPTLDINGADQYGYMSLQATIYGGERWSTAKAFLYKASHRDNLHIATNAHVTKVIFDGKTAVGVAFERDRIAQKIAVKREIILSAGAIGSPHILLLSGVGPKDQLENHKIPVTADLPVGENFHDQSIFADTSFTLEAPLALTEEKLASWVTKLQYYFFSTGIYASAPDAGCYFLRSPHQPQEHKYPYIGISLFPGAYSLSADNYDILLKNTSYKKEALHVGPASENSFAFLVYLLHPGSRGWLRLNSADPHDPPLINPNHLQDPVDLKSLVSAMKELKRLEETEAFKRIGAMMSRRRNPQCAELPWGTDKYWACAIRSALVSGIHVAGSCKMGADNDTTAVVDPRLRVRGLQNLRVVDTSIFPEVTSGYTMAPTIMTGEKGADIIRKDHDI